jgi:hypothetical protein
MPMNDVGLGEGYQNDLKTTITIPQDPLEPTLKSLVQDDMSIDNGLREGDFPDK